MSIGRAGLILLVWGLCDGDPFTTGEWLLGLWGFAVVLKVALVGADA